MRRNILVCYDIAHPRRLRRVHRIVRDYGDPVQYSMYLCRLVDRVRAELEAKLHEVIERDEDRVLLLDLGRLDALAHLPCATLLGRQDWPEALATVVV